MIILLFINILLITNLYSICKSMQSQAFRNLIRKGKDILTIFSIGECIYEGHLESNAHSSRGCQIDSSGTCPRTSWNVKITCPTTKLTCPISIKTKDTIPFSFLILHNYVENT